MLSSVWPLLHHGNLRPAGSHLNDWVLRGAHRSLQVFPVVVLKLGWTSLTGAAALACRSPEPANSVMNARSKGPGLFLDTPTANCRRGQMAGKAG